jgi:hypothetical protein
VERPAAAEEQAAALADRRGRHRGRPRRCPRLRAAQGRRQRPSQNAAASRSTQADQRGDIDGNAVVPPDADQEELPGDVIPPEDGGGAYWEHSMDKAAAFMDDVVLGDYPSAISHGSQDFQAVFSDGTELFGQQIAEATNGGTLGDYSLDWATYDATVDADVVSITIIMEEGWPDDFTVLVSEEDGYLVVVGFE